MTNHVPDGSRVGSWEPDDRADRILGCLLGGAVGDGFGFAVEFMRLQEILDRYGPDGLQHPQFRDDRLLVTDDTQMTMFTAEGLIRAQRRLADRGMASVEAVGWNALQRWLKTQGEEAECRFDDGWLVDDGCLWNRRAPGATCIGALRNDMPPDYRADNNSKGCGGVMRVAPAGLLEADWSDERVFELGASLASLTHGHPTGYLASGAMALIIRKLMDGSDMPTAVRSALDLLRPMDRSDETVAALEQALQFGGETGPDHRLSLKVLGEGWVAEEALAVGVYSAMQGEDFPDVFRIAANHDGDSDSTASIAGQIYGAAYGCGGLPHDWTRRLDVLEPLLILAHDLWAVGCGLETVESYPPN
ncbi:MAG: ADP-ribosylglycohydrolase family protein [Acidobacteria bacterium]|uniref:ADP-ribosylglycohydrolase family protein n=1 Tax=Candidatus Polarisedimenticola svalbardensis TaxID=2886004 RepID=A0A8J6Y4Q5_9BACT|nr:ADP-ribosylglycohydrolase family protein [Candidatus Polarisedimenticola svalbardensis]